MSPARYGGVASYVAVIDAKGSSGSRVLLLSVDSDYRIKEQSTPTWPGTMPKDLESVAAIPNARKGASQQFVAAQSSGTFYRFTISDDGSITNVLKGVQKLDGAASDTQKQIESVAFYVNGSTTYLVWARRGSRDHSARIYAAPLINETNKIDFKTSSKWDIQEDNFLWMRQQNGNDQDSRLISDLKVTRGGAVYGTAAYDGGNSGPFGGVVYNLGTMSVSGGAVQFSINSNLVPLTDIYVTGKGKKIEALEFFDAGSDPTVILGSDDESLKGAYMIVP